MSENTKRPEWAATFAEAVSPLAKERLEQALRLIGDAAEDVKYAAREVRDYLKARANAEPPPAVRLMHYRAAALTGLTMNAPCAHDHEVERRHSERLTFGDHVAREADAYARAMLAAEGSAT